MNAHQQAAETIRAILPGEVISQQDYTADYPDSAPCTTTRSGGAEHIRILGESWIVQRPTLDDIALMVGGLFSPGNYFAIIDDMRLACDCPENCIYIQAAVGGDKANNAGGYVVEARFVHGWVKGAETQTVTDSQHQKFADAAEVTEIFQAFASGSAPNVADWEDITRKIGLGDPREQRMETA